jgi:hypothetical protein
VSSIYYSTYLVLLIFIVLVAIGGYESTMRLVGYLDLQLRIGIIQIRVFFMRRKLEKEMRSFHKKYGGKNVSNKNLH